MSKVDDFLAIIRGEIGRPYVYGADGPNAFDCSGLPEYAAAQLGVKLPHNAAEQQRVTSPVSNPLPGDLVFWGNPAYHVAVYIGNGQVIAAPHSGSTVQIQSLWGNPTYGRISGMGTALAPITDTLAAATRPAWDPFGIKSETLAGARKLIIEALFVTLGLGLVAAGAYQAVKSTRRSS